MVVLRILRIEIVRIVSNGHLTAQPEQLSKRGKPGSCVNLATWGEFVTWQTKAVSLSNHHNNNKMPYIPSTFWGFFNLGELCDSNLLERISFNPFNTICKGGSKTLQESCKQVQKAAKEFFSQYLKQKHPIFLNKTYSKASKTFCCENSHNSFCQNWN